MGQRVATATIHFTASPCTIGSSVILRLPAGASEQLTSRGQVAVQVTIGGEQVVTVLEPDGRRGHWLKLDDTLRRATGDGASVEVELEVVQDWPEPTVPADLAVALVAAPQTIRGTWDDITPMARWEWVRWVGATANPATRARRVEVSIDKMANGKRRPCCFDLSACTDPDVASNGKLRDTPS